MTTTRATDAAIRLMDHLDASPVAGVTIAGWYDGDPDQDASPGFSSELAAEMPAPERLDYAIIELSIGTVILNAESGPLRWWLKTTQRNERGREASTVADEGVLDGDVTPIADAIRAAAPTDETEKS